MRTVQRRKVYTLPHVHCTEITTSWSPGHACPTISLFIAAVRMEQSSTDGNKAHSDIDNKKNSDITTAIATPPDACGKRYNYREAMKRCERERSEPCLDTSCKFIEGTIKEVKL